jgi:hypothetical protein
MPKKEATHRQEKKKQSTRKQTLPTGSYWQPPPETLKLENASLTFAPQPAMPLKEAMMNLTRDFDWDAFHRDQNKVDPVKPGMVYIINTAFSWIPLSNAYGWFHKRLSAALSATKVEDFFTVTTDEDHVNIAERYAEEILRVTDIEDALYFRSGVWFRELRGQMAYPKQRDHAGHTLNNYLLGWYFFVHCPIIIGAFQHEMARRDPEGSRFCNELYMRFGEVWCFASLLHDVGYIFEGELHKDHLEAIDPWAARGIQHAKRYFTDIFWKDLKLRGADEKQAAKRLAGFDESWSLSTLDSPELVIDFLRMIGPLGALGKNVCRETGKRALADLPADGFELWVRHFTHFGQKSMAKRIRIIERELYSFAEKGLPGTSSRVLDHGVCGALLLLKYSTVWFRLIFACKDSSPKDDSFEAQARHCLESATDNWSGYYAAHWWKNILWATAAVAVHNVQQFPNISGLSPLRYDEDALAYLGVLVDILQEWDRPSSQRDRTVEGDEYRLSSPDVTIATTTDGRVSLSYRCRDNTAAYRTKKMHEELDRALADWSKVVEVSFRDG